MMMATEPDLIELEVLKDTSDLVKLREVLKQAETIGFLYGHNGEFVISSFGNGRSVEIRLLNFLRRETWQHIREFLSLQTEVRVKQVILNECVDLIWVLEPVSKQLEVLKLYFGRLGRQEEWINDNVIPTFSLLKHILLHVPSTLRQTESTLSALLSCFANDTTLLKIAEINRITASEDDTMATIIHRSKDLQVLKLDFCGILTSSSIAESLHNHDHLEELTVNVECHQKLEAKALVQACFTLPRLQKLKLTGLQHISCNDWIGDVIANGQATLTDICFPSLNGGNGNVVDAILEGATMNPFVKKLSIDCDKHPSTEVFSELLLRNRTIEELTVYLDAEMTALKSLACNTSIKVLRLHINITGANLSNLFDSIGHALASNTVLETLHFKCVGLRIDYWSTPLTVERARNFAEGLAKNHTLKEFSFKDLCIGRYEAYLMDGLRANTSLTKFQIAYAMTRRKEHKKQVHAWCRWNAVVGTEYDSLSDELLLPFVLRRACSKSVQSLHFCLRTRVDLLIQAILRSSHRRYRLMKRRRE